MPACLVLGSGMATGEHRTLLIFTPARHHGAEPLPIGHRGKVRERQRNGERDRGRWETGIVRVKVIAAEGRKERKKEKGERR